MKTKTKGKLMGGGIPQQPKVGLRHGITPYDDPNQCV